MTRSGCPDQEYDLLGEIGTGSFGSVYKARSKESHRIVAIKIMKRKFEAESDCDKLLECKLRILLPSHSNIVQIYDTFFSPSNELHFVMEYMNGGNLYQLTKERRTQESLFQPSELRSIMEQILAAVSHIHRHAIFHRDMKPENLLINNNGHQLTVKLADFGLARQIGSMPPYTEYVSTRWYRAPEVLLRSKAYTASVDLWAVGCIFAELITLQPLLPGTSEIDQLYRICQLLGSPGNNRTFGRRKSPRPEKRLSPGFARKKTTDLASEIVASPASRSIQKSGTEWREGVKLAHQIGFDFPQLPPTPFETVLPNASPSMLDLLQQFLVFDPAKRKTAEQALHHHFFYDHAAPSTHHIYQAAAPLSRPNHLYNTHELAGVFAGQREGTPSSSIIYGRKERESTSIQLVNDTYDTTDEDSPISIPSPPFAARATAEANHSPNRPISFDTLLHPSPSSRTETPPYTKETWQTTSKNDTYHHAQTRPVFSLNKSGSPAKRPSSHIDDYIEEEMHTHRRLDFYLQNNHEPAFQLENVKQYGMHLPSWAPPKLPTEIFPTTAVKPLYSRPSTGSSVHDKRRSIMSDTEGKPKGTNHLHGIDSLRHKHIESTSDIEDHAESGWTWLKIL